MKIRSICFFFLLALSNTSLAQVKYYSTDSCGLSFGLGLTEDGYYYLDYTYNFKHHGAWKFELSSGFYKDDGKGNLDFQDTLFGVSYRGKRSGKTITISEFSPFIKTVQFKYLTDWTDAELAYRKYELTKPKFKRAHTKRSFDGEYQYRVFTDGDKKVRMQISIVDNKYTFVFKSPTCELLVSRGSIQVNENGLLQLEDPELRTYFYIKLNDDQSISSVLLPLVNKEVLFEKM